MSKKIFAIDVKEPCGASNSQKYAKVGDRISDAHVGSMGPLAGVFVVSKLGHKYFIPDTNINAIRYEEDENTDRPLSADKRRGRPVKAA